jgi:hypothetical protein
MALLESESKMPLMPDFNEPVNMNEALPKVMIIFVELQSQMKIVF